MAIAGPADGAEISTAAVAVEVQFAITGERSAEPSQIQAWADAVIHQFDTSLLTGDSGTEVSRTEVCIRLVDEAESNSLNSRFRAIDKPTNVLSFPADVTLPESEQRYLGDIVICDPVVQREADAQDKTVCDHYAHMVVHGMLHLYGYDHVDPAEADAMENLERDILSRLGIADPYQR